MVEERSKVRKQKQLLMNRCQFTAWHCMHEGFSKEEAADLWLEDRGSGYSEIVDGQLCVAVEMRVELSNEHRWSERTELRDKDADATEADTEQFSTRCKAALAAAPAVPVLRCPHKRSEPDLNEDQETLRKEMWLGAALSVEPLSDGKVLAERVGRAPVLQRQLRCLTAAAPTARTPRMEGEASEQAPERFTIVQGTMTPAAFHKFWRSWAKEFREEIATYLSEKKTTPLLRYSDM